MARALRIVPLSIAEYEAAPPRMRMLLDAFRGRDEPLAREPSAGSAAHPAADRAVVSARADPLQVLPERVPRLRGTARGVGPSDVERSAAAVAGPGVVPPAEAPCDSSGAEQPRASRHSTGSYDFTFEAQFDRLGHRPRGSNQWAVAPSRTADGSTLLLINPHQSFVGVQRYAEIHLDSREGLRFSGLTVFGFLLPYMGHNERLGWAYTDNYADHSDLYGLVFDDAPAPLRYRYGDTYRTAEAWTDSIRVRTADGMRDAREFRFWNSHYGPIVGVAEDGRPLAVKLARMAEGGWYDQWDAMIRARTLDAWKAAVATLRVPYMNTMYADADGNIGYIYNSAVPRRLPASIRRASSTAATRGRSGRASMRSTSCRRCGTRRPGWLLNTNSTPFTATTGCR
jgi:acyl-homoserine lactone acylase PvdQ